MQQRFINQATIEVSLKEFLWKRFQVAYHARGKESERWMQSLVKPF